VADQLGEAVLEVTANVGGAKTALTDLRTALTGIDTLAKNQSSSISAIGRAVEAANRSAITSINGLADAYKRVQTQQEAVKRNANSISQTATQSFLSRGVTPGTTSASEQQRLASLERRAEVRRLQTAGGGGGGVGTFLRDLRLREEGEKKVAATREAGYKKAAASEKTLLALADQRVKKEAGAQRGGGRVSNVLSNALIGGAFPLLFGQGAGASAGGLLGGAAGGLGGGQFGFAGSLIGTAIGAQVDAAVQKLQTLGKALQDPIGSFSALQQAALLSSSSVEKNADALIAAGRSEEAAALIRADIASRFGDLNEASVLTASLDELNRSFAELGVSLIQELGPALATAASGLADFIKQLSLLPQKQAAEDIQQAKEFIGTDAGRQAQFDKLFAEQGGTYGESGKFSADSVGAALRASREFLSINGILTTQQESQAAAAAEYAAARERASSIAALDAEITVAGIRGEKAKTLELEKQKLALQETAALNSLPANASQVTIDQTRLEFAQKRLAIEEQIRNLPAAGSTADFQDQLQKLQDFQAKLSVDSSAFVLATSDVVKLQDEIQQVDGKKATITAELLTTGFETGALDKSITNQQQLVASLREAASALPVDSKEFEDAAARYRKEKTALETQTNKLEGTGDDSGSKLAEGGKTAGDAIRAAASAFENSAKNVKDTLVGSFELLRPNLQQQLLSAARANINFEIFDPTKIRNDPSKIFQAASASQQIKIEGGTALRKALSDLTNKRWTVNVDVDASTGASAVQLG
jgi:hypothetical protein